MDGSVIVPLYVYPSLGAWDPVFDMAASYPRVQFTAVVNVHNGPGEGALPNPEYSQAIQALNSFNNVRTVGYVSTAWCARDLSSVLDDIAAYSFWGEYHDSLAIDGIFVDETPTRYSSDIVSYLQTIAHAVDESDGLKEGFIVHNPGALPEPEFFKNVSSDGSVYLTPDVTVIFENSFSKWTEENIALAEATKLYDRNKLGMVLHSVPELATITTEITLRQLLAVGHSIWLTGSRNYTNLDTYFPAFVDCLAALLS